VRQVYLFITYLILFQRRSDSLQNAWNPVSTVHASPDSHIHHRLVDNRHLIEIVKSSRTDSLEKRDESHLEF